MSFVWGCECKLGWGYNESLDKLIPVEGKPSNVTSEIINNWEYSIHNLSSTTVVYWRSISPLLESSYKKFLDFQIIFNDSEYWQLQCYFLRRKDECRKFSTYPPNCSDFVNRIEYGVELRVQFLKTEVPKKEDEIITLFRERRPNEAQKKVKCRVLINYNEIREITLGELIEFMNKLDQEHNLEYNIPVAFQCNKLILEFRETIIDNQNEFVRFLSCLYCAYRKIEMKMKKAGYPDILQDLEFNESSFVIICVNLHEAKRDYQSVSRNDFLQIYPVLKRLFFRYIDYIKYSIKYLVNIDEGNHLPRTVGEITTWMKKLNIWYPLRVGNKWINCTSSFVAIPHGFDNVIEILQKITKLKDYQIINNNEVEEPYIGEENHKKILFGFVDMEGANPDQISDSLNLFERECPHECTADFRRWICTKCGDFVKIKIHPNGSQFLLCSCGSKTSRDRLFTCYHPKHRSPKLWPTYHYSDLIPEILRKLEEIRIRTEGITDRRILTAITYLSNNKNEGEIKNALKNLDDVNLNNHVRHLINLYFQKTKNENIFNP